ncbi:MAG: hypothetical protein IKL89_02160 [Clostridia bacterium]|nr:hypothetical protein [Clostridia bacterium]
MFTLYPHPEHEPVSAQHSVTVGGLSAPCMEARVSAMPYNRVWPGFQRGKDQTEIASFLNFAADEPVELTVTWPKDVDSVVIRPLRHGIKPAVEGRCARFILPGAGQYTVEADGPACALHIFIDPAVPVQEEATYSFAPGLHHAGHIDLSSGESLYIAPGAVVHGEVCISDAEDVRIFGGGILDNSTFARPDGRCVDFPNGCLKIKSCRNVRVEGITFRDSSTWTATIFNSEEVHFDRVKLIGMWRYNSDGIDFVNSRHCSVRNSFLRNFDDCVVIKGLKGWDHENVSDIRTEGCVVWCDWGRNLELGAETCADRYDRITFRDCDLIHGAHIMMDIQNGDRAHVRDVLFSDIRVEYNRCEPAPVYQKTEEPYPGKRGHMPHLFLAENYCGMWSQDNILGNIEGVRLENIQIFADEGMPMPPSVLRAKTEESFIRDITFKNVTFNGKKIEEPEELNLTCGDFVGKVTIE